MTRTRLRPLATLGALVLLGACGMPRLRQIPGSDRVARSSPQPKVSGRTSSGCGGRVGPVTVSSGGNATVGDRGGMCAEVTTDTVPDPTGDVSQQPPRRVP